MGECGKCGHDNPAWVVFCVACGTPLRSESGTASVERSHIEYILTQVPVWRNQGIKPPGSASHLMRVYRQRLDQLDGPAPASAPPPPPPSVPSVPSVAPVPPAPSSGISPGLSEFLEAHWLKLLAVLAASFIFAGMRQVLGWEWVSRLAVGLIPLVPITLSALLIRLGIRRADRSGLGPRVSAGIGIVLTAFVVTSVNRRWLGGAIPPTWTHCLAGFAATVAAYVVRRHTRESAYGHAILGGSALTVGLGAAGVSQVVTGGGAVPWHIAAALSLVGAAYLTEAVRRARRSAPCGTFQGPPGDGPGSAGVPPPTGDGPRSTGVPPATADIWRMWGALTTASGAALALSHMATGPGMAEGPLAVLLVCAVAYGASARLMASAELAVASATSLSVAGVYAMQGFPDAGLVEWGYLAASVGVVWAASALGPASRTSAAPAASEPRVCGDRSAESFLTMAIAAFGLAGLMAALRCVEGAAGGSSLTDKHWAGLSGLAAICAIAYSAVAVAMRRPVVQFAAAPAVGVAVAVAFGRLMVTTMPVPFHGSGHALAAAAVALLGIGLVAHRFTLRARAGEGGALDFGWAAPWIYAASFCAVVVVAVMSGRALDAGGDAAIWTGLAIPVLVGLFGAPALRSASDALMPQSLAFAGAIGIAAMLAVAGGEQWSSVGVGGALLGSAWLGLTVASLAQQTRGGLWSRPLQAAGVVALIAGAVAYVSAEIAGDGSVARMAAVAAVMAAVSALTSATRPRGDALLTVSSVVMLLMPWVTMDAVPETWQVGVRAAATAVCALAYGRAACLGLSGAGWASGVAAAGAWFGILQVTGAVPEAWMPAAIAPGMIALFALGERTRWPAELRSALRRCAVGAALVAACMGEARLLALTDAEHGPMAATMALLAVAFTAGVVLRRSARWAVAAGGAASVAEAHGAAALGLTSAPWSLCFSACALLPVPVMVALRRRPGWESVSEGLTGVVAAHALVALLSAASFAGEPGAGATSILAIAVAGAAWASLFAIGRGRAFAHMAFGAFLIAYSLFLYDRVAIGAGVMDLYMIPLGAYLLVLGSLSDRRGDGETAQPLWWAGLLVTMSPTFAAFWTHFTEGGTSLHAFILVAECMGAVAWGIAHRIRAFVVLGTAFAWGFAGVLGAATVKQIWVGLLALAVGLSLLVAVFQLSTRGEETRAWLRRALSGWRAWR
ncbi:MAG: hypothetical protein FJX72_06260 [Armatimonadetes bacterium]|nr:hypothetical protein [Armatimonadota bacterium]